MEKFLVLGIGNAQVDLLKKLSKDNNIEVHALSNTEKGRGYQYTDYFELIDITDIEMVFDYVVKNNISYIYSVGSDVAMPTVMSVATTAGLNKFVSHETARLCNTKHELRDYLKKCYGSVPFDVLSEDCNIKNIDFPAIVKPVDSQGQRGVSTVRNINELKVAYDYAVSFSRSSTVIVENKIQGPEISVNVYMKDGELVFFLPSDRLAWEGYDGGIIHKHILPASLGESASENVRKLVVETLAALEINNGPAYFQIMLEGDAAYLIEVTPRLDGCHMWNLIKQSTGVDLLEISLNHLMGQDISLPSSFSIAPSTLEFICQPPNTNYQKDSDDFFEEVKHLEHYYQNGDEVASMNGKMEKCGYVIRLGDE